jgi:hypothetical protein
MNFRSIFIVVAVTCCLPSPILANENEGNLFHFEYRDGTAITATFIETNLSWTAVSELGQMSKQRINASQIEYLSLTDEPASEQLAEVLLLIGQLDDDDFYIREDAESQLRKLGRRFRSVIERSDSLKTSDGKYRLKRILTSLGSDKKKDRIELDQLTLLDGNKLDGDAGNGEFKVSFQNSDLSIPRSKLASISRFHGSTVSRPNTASTVSTRLFHDHESFMKDRDLKLVDFQMSPKGVELEKDNEVGTMFADRGLLLGTGYPQGVVKISGYPIKAGDKPVGDNSVCVFQSRARNAKRFQGVMEVTFCMPGKPWIPHGVNEFGVFLSRVNHSRDVLVEAWDASDRLIGVCESNDEPCTFCGIRSNVPIAKIRILSNPWLLELRQRVAKRLKKEKKPANVPTIVDKDFAADSMMYSKHVLIDSTSKWRHYLSQKGDMIPVNWLRIFDQERIEFGSPTFKLLSVSLPEANCVALQKKSLKLPKRLNSDTSWLALMSNNSVLKWDPKRPFYSQTLKQDINRKDIVAIWPAGNSPHMPLDGDFKAGSNVLVYPGCRVATGNLTVDKNGFRWNDGVVLKEDLHANNENKVDARDDDRPDEVAPTKTSYSFDVAEIPEYETPTIWFKQPTTILANQGTLRLAGDEVIVYGGESNFQLKSLDKQRIVIVDGENEHSIPLSDTIAILPPQE